MKQKIALAIHGGAGTILKTNMTADREKAYRAALSVALQKGYERLAAGGSSLDAVEIAVRELEDCPLFNAGKGAVFTADGTHELDASIMWGKNLSAGAYDTGVLSPPHEAGVAWFQSRIAEVHA